MKEACVSEYLCVGVFSSISTLAKSQLNDEGDKCACVGARDSARVCVCICAGARAAVNQRFILRASIACTGVEAGGQESTRMYLLLPLP